MSRVRFLALLIAGVILGAALVPAAVDGRTDVRRTYATSYCLHGRMADGSYTRSGSAASNVHRLGTRIKLTGRSFYGQRYFTIRDTGGALGDGHLDLWTSSCGTARAWGHRSVSYRVLGR
jgi:3D (Asp-Asp-Asp) domain-containing protein